MTALVLGLALLLTVPILAFALIFAVGASCGVAAYHLSRQVVVSYQPTRKAFDAGKEKSAAVAQMRQLAQETAELQKSYLGGLQLTREQYLAAEGKK